MAEGPELGHQFRVEPVRVLHRRPKIVDHQDLRATAETPEGILQAGNKVIGRLSEGDLAVGLPAVAQDDAKHVRLATLPVRTDDRRSGAEIDLGLFACGTLHAPHRQRAALSQTPHESLDAVVAAREALLADKVLEDPLGTEFLLQLRLDDRPVRLALARPAALGRWGFASRAAGAVARHFRVTAAAGR